MIVRVKLFPATSHFEALETEVNEFLATMSNLNILDVSIRCFAPGSPATTNKWYATVAYKE